MKLTAFDRLFSAKVSTGGTTLGFSSGSNNASGDLSGGTDVVGTPGDYTVVGLRAQVSLASNIGGGSLGDVLTIIQASPRIAAFAAPSNTASIGSNALLKTGGGEGRVVTVASSGATYTVMVGAANTWDITLTSGTVALSLSGPAGAGYESSVLLALRQDGVGNRTVTWPGSVVWQSGSPPTLSTSASDVDFVLLETWDNGTTWFGFPVGAGGGGTPATTVESETTFGITPAVGTDTEYARQDHTHGSPANPVTEEAVQDAGRWELAVITGDPPDPLYADGDYLYIWVPGA